MESMLPGPSDEAATRPSLPWDFLEKMGPAAKMIQRAWRRWEGVSGVVRWRFRCLSDVCLLLHTI